MKRYLGALVGLVMGLFVSQGFSATLQIDQYPTNVKAGDTVDVQVAWSDIPLDKDYVLRIQLENWDVKPGICVFKDLEKFSEEGTAVITIPVPQSTRKGPASRFLAAFLSKSAEWDDALIVATTPKNVNLVSLLQIGDYPTEVQAGQDITVGVSWAEVSTDGTYKLVVQLENWDVKPGIVYAKEIEKFQAKDSQNVAITIPADARGASGHRIVAAFISKAEGWNKVFAIDETAKNITVKPAVHDQSQVQAQG